MNEYVEKRSMENSRYGHSSPALKPQRLGVTTRICFQKPLKLFKVYICYLISRRFQLKLKNRSKCLCCVVKNAADISSSREGGKDVYLWSDTCLIDFLKMVE